MEFTKPDFMKNRMATMQHTKEVADSGGGGQLDSRRRWQHAGTALAGSDSPGATRAGFRRPRVGGQHGQRAVLSSDVRPDGLPVSFGRAHADRRADLLPERGGAPVGVFCLAGVPHPGNPTRGRPFAGAR